MVQPLILFDFDGVLVDSTAVVVEAFNQALRERGLEEVSKQQLASAPTERLARSAGLWFWQVPGFMDLFRARVQEALSEVCLHAELEELLVSFSRYAELGVVSSVDEQVVRGVLEEAGVSELFSGVYASTYFSLNKGIRLARKEAVVDAFRVLYVSDEPRGVYAARRAGVDSLAVTWGLSSKEVLLAARPRMLASSFSEAEHLVKAWLVSRGD